ncbi:MAG: hypothetical protein Q8P18_19845 [Pseudomonadota bacterium]|nr:hypothetical protein [Pseudomonadota bacterium]
MSDLDLERLRQARRVLASDAGGAACPPPERLYDAATGALPPKEVAPILDHVGACGACASEWSLVRAALDPTEALGAGDPPPDVAAPLPTVEVLRPTRPHARSPWRRLGFAMGALGAAAGLALWVRPPVAQEEGTPVFRALDTPAPGGRIADGAALPRDAFTLEWVPGPAGTRYALTVGDEAGRPLHLAGGFDTASATVPVEALAGLPDGATVVWQVEETWVDGTTRRSPVYRSVVR